MAEEVLIYLSIIIAIAAVLTIIARLIRQPSIIAYLIAGVIAGPLFLGIIGPSESSADLIGSFAHIGVALLLFIVGLSLDLRVLREIGGVSTFAGLAEILLTGGIGFVIALGIGFESITALYIAVALSFSSTVVVVKILSDKKEMDTLHGKISLGILIVEDFVAAIALMAIPLVRGESSAFAIIQELGLAVLLIAGIFIFAIYGLGRFLDYLAKNQETLFLFGITWALIIATLFQKLGFSLEIGALIAGMSLASSKYTLDLSGKIKPLRDFFVVLFFVFFGSQLATSLSPSIIKNALILSVFVIIGKPLIVMTALRIFGYKKRTNFLAGASIAQISEFSLILILLGYTLGHLNQEIMSLAVLVALITIGVSSYSIYYSHSIFNKISHFLNIFEGKKDYNENQKNKNYEVFLFGYHRMGYKIFNVVKKSGSNCLIVDYNPKVIASLIRQKIDCIYGDAGNKNFLYDIGIGRAKLVISTIPQEEINLMIREALKEIGSDAVFIATAEQPRAALDLYDSGIDYVIIPHHLGGDFASQMIKKLGTEKGKYAKIGREHKKELAENKRKSSFED